MKVCKLIFDIDLPLYLKLLLYALYLGYPGDKRQSGQ